MYKGSNVLILGLAKSGNAAAALLHRLGANVVVNDMKPLEENEEAKALQALGIEVICGEHPLSLFDRKIDFVVKNPGIPYHNPIVVEAMKREIKVITEVEIASVISEAAIIGITGSNGKTTTTTLTYEMLLGASKKPLIAGNIGTVVCEVAEKATKDNLLVTELSSFQLQGTDQFRPAISVLLNIFDAHLDYHGTRKEYAHAKGKIFANQTEDDIAIYNDDDPTVKKLVENVIARKVPFSSTKKVDNGAWIHESSLYFKEEKIVDLGEIVLPGKHNLENILAAIAVAKTYGVSNDHIRKVLQTFAGVKHRLQYVTSIEDRRFYNDSKATNILATQTALSAFETPVILLAGGLDRGNDFDELIPYLQHVKAVITFGQTASKIMKIAEEAGIKTVKHVDNVNQAVPVAYELSEAGDTILLSPACASWDQYKTFEQRGDMFINSVHKLKI
ncbi:UDP-N-acetylmuramoyl-L-alanine--D-glutamate ligase [Lottiidibacillus patelloidae]|uniref:UDP-N-acetylmuramoylalanine--D-glutamate ligase n=2 Tax=Lottiidibacillus patelloidae TaxID=2670334 RepID=A0A263BYF8_9BACI|nr:UDP-N-acetylmuramoyl-L-alanine--D-glutamate ligase [Lottiidibacillus patelloidae]OZM58759.1 UDP-N-acetylmuramoyl-L-alanine--D-glutamate ligase [Lottiidibacillus patelloidae]